MAKSKSPRLAALANVKLASAGRRNGQSYTDDERNLAATVSATVLTATGMAEAEDRTTDEVVDIVNTIAAAQQEERGEVSIPSLCRAAYRAVEAKRLADDSTTAAFPKVKDGKRVGRDHTSLGLLFRGAFAELGIEASDIDVAFPSPYKAKKAS